MLLNGWIHKVNVNFIKILLIADNIHTLAIEMDGHTKTALHAM
jgi:hypothetical protein